MNQELHDELMKLATLAASGKTIDMAAIEKLKALAAPSVPRNGPGRPKGARTRAETPSVKRADEFISLLISGLSKADAARKIADKYQVAESSVWSDARRHDQRLAEKYRILSEDVEQQRRSMHLARKFHRGYRRNGRKAL
jgi:hypothetical protein